MRFFWLMCFFASSLVTFQASASETRCSSNNTPSFLKDLYVHDEASLRAYLQSEGLYDNESNQKKIPPKTKQAKPHLSFTGCKCGPAISSIAKAVTPESISGFRLIAACNVIHLIPENFISGLFHFRGKEILTGSIVYRWGAAEDEIIFVYLSATGDRRRVATFFNEGSVAAQQLKPPPLDEIKTCWEALATIEVTQLTTLKDWGSELSGTYIGSFNPLSIGKFRQCAD